MPPEKQYRATGDLSDAHAWAKRGPGLRTLVSSVGLSSVGSASAHCADMDSRKLQCTDPDWEGIVATHDFHAARSRVRATPLNIKALQTKANWSLEQDGERRYYLVEALIDGDVIGRAHGWFERNGSFILEKIEVEPSQRSKGYGSAIIELLRSHAREQGCAEFAIKGVMRSNERAIALYESLGAQRVNSSPTHFAFVLAPP